MSEDRDVARPFESVHRLTDAWLTATEHTMDSILAANRATIAALGLSDDPARDTPTASLAYVQSGWSTNQSRQHSDTVTLGDRVEFSKVISEDDIETFAAISGDTNRLHLDETYARESRFGGRIAHGGLVSGLISAALARLPGVTIYLSQDVRFLAPVRIGDELRAVCEVVEDLGEDTYRVTTSVYKAGDEQVIDGEAVILIDDPPETGGQNALNKR